MLLLLFFAFLLNTTCLLTTRSLSPCPVVHCGQALAVAADCTQHHDDFSEAEKVASCRDSYSSMTYSDPVKGTLLGLGTSSAQEAAARLSRAPAASCDMPVTPVLGPPEACSTTSSMMSVVYDEQQPSQTGQEPQQASPGKHDTDQAAEPPKAFAASLFFARVPPTVPYEAILELFEQFGKVASLNLFRPWATAKTSKVRAASTQLLAICRQGHRVQMAGMLLIDLQRGAVLLPVGMGHGLLHALLSSILGQSLQRAHATRPWQGESGPKEPSQSGRSGEGPRTCVATP